MKKIFYLIMVSSSLLACKQQAKSPTHEISISAGPVSVEPLSLNKGAKWKADSITNYHVTSLKVVFDNFRQKPLPSIEDYHLLANDFGTELNQMIKDCKMSGEDHNALHKWLEPVLKESNQMKSDADIAAAQRSFKSIDERLSVYSKYFQ